MNRIRRPLAAGIILALMVVTAGNAAAQPTSFRARLSGGEEVPPVNTDARGLAVFNVVSARDEMRFRLVVLDIENVVAAHIHCAATGVNGPVGVTLFAAGPTSANGVLTRGTITAPDGGNGCGWADLDAVVAAMTSGNTYVNVHTIANLPGEIRGQIR